MTKRKLVVVIFMLVATIMVSANCMKVQASNDEEEHILCTKLEEEMLERGFETDIVFNSEIFENNFQTIKEFLKSYEIDFSISSEQWEVLEQLYEKLEMVEKEKKDSAWQSAHEKPIDMAEYEGLIVSNMLRKAPEPEVEEEPIQEVQEPQASTVVSMRLTAYCNCSSCCGQWAGGPTASGTMPTAYNTVAMGSNYGFGTRIYIPALASWPNGGWFTVEDRGVGNGTVDIFFASHGETIQFGVMYTDVYIY